MTSEGIELVKEFEGFRSKAYLDPTGLPTIGYGTTLICKHKIQLGMEINELVGRLLLQVDLETSELEVRRIVHAVLNPNQFDALTSFHYNTGGLFQSTLLRVINSGGKVTENLFTMWNKARVNGVLVELPGLTARRKAEFTLYERA
jgi:lysozyme